MKEINPEKRSHAVQTEHGIEYHRNRAHLKPQNCTGPNKLVQDDLTTSVSEPVALPHSMSNTAPSLRSMSLLNQRELLCLLY